jgi:SAM-dependent methyltransferase
MEINKLPFFIGVSSDKDNFGFPDELDFNLYFDANYKMYRLKPTDNLEQILKKVYEFGSLADGSISSESGKVYIDKTVNYIQNYFEFYDKSRILEIGIGKGIIINELHSLFPNCYFDGIEPGKFDMINLNPEVNIYHEFYPTPKLKGPYDLIYSLLVLEHIENPLTFINQLKNQLSHNGKIILSVPNCEPYIESGDISIFIHEHYSYFTSESIIKLAEMSKLYIEDISLIEGAFYFVLTKKENSCPESTRINFSFFERKKVEFENVFLKKISNFEDNDVAIYCPIRALNFLYVIGKKNFRLVDDNTQVKDKYLPILNSRIENFDDLLKSPPKLIVIFSRTFGNKIREKCHEYDEMKHTEILLLNEI